MIAYFRNLNSFSSVTMSTRKTQAQTPQQVQEKLHRNAFSIRYKPFPMGLGSGFFTKLALPYIKLVTEFALWAQQNPQVLVHTLANMPDTQRYLFHFTALFTVLARQYQNTGLVDMHMVHKLMPRNLQALFAFVARQSTNRAPFYTQMGQEGQIANEDEFVTNNAGRIMAHLRTQCDGNRFGVNTPIFREIITAIQWLMTEDKPTGNTRQKTIAEIHAMLLYGTPVYLMHGTFRDVAISLAAVHNFRKPLADMNAADVNEDDAGAGIRRPRGDGKPEEEKAPKRRKRVSFASPENC